MAITGLTSVETEIYYSMLEDKDLPDNEKTGWIIGTLDLNVRALVNDNSSLIVNGPDGSNALLQKNSQRNIEACRFGLKGFSNFKDPSQNDIEPKFLDRVVNNKTFKVMSDEVLSKIPPVIIAEIGDAILQRNVLSEDMRKKLMTPLQQ